MVTPTMAAFRPYDVTGFKSRDTAAVVLLANSLGWSVLKKLNGPVHLIADDGKLIRVPDNTGLKMDIFRSWIHQIATHSGDQSIGRELVDEIVRQTKLNRDHARLMYDLAEDEESKPESEPEPETDKFGLPKGEWQGKEPYILSMEPWISQKGRVSDFALVREWSDGHTDYVCAHCLNHNLEPVTAPHIKGITAHQQWHIRRGQVEGRVIQTKAGSKRRSFIPVEEPRTETKKPAVQRAMAQMDQEVAVAALAALRKLEQIQEILGPGNEEEISALKAELAKRDDRIAKLEGNLTALRDLLAGDL